MGKARKTLFDIEKALPDQNLVHLLVIGKIRANLYMAFVHIAE